MLASLLRPFASLPLRFHHALGAALGWLVFFASPRYAKRLRENLAASGRCAADCKIMLRRTIAEAGKSVLELLPVWLRPLPQVLQLIREYHGLEHLEAAQKEGRGIIFLTPHMGCFEITSLYYAARHPITILYRPPKLRFVAPLMEAGRKRGMAALATTDIRGVRTLYRALKRGEAIGMLPDQVPGEGEGVWADFFGRPAYTMTLVSRLASASGAPVVFAFAERLPRGRGYRMWFEPGPPELREEGAAGAKALNAAVEKLVSKCPEQYLWSYNRYKTPRGARREG